MDDQSEMLKAQDVRDLLRREIAKVGSQTEWAKQKRANRTLVNGVLTGRRKLQPKLLKALGLKRITFYQRVKHVRDGHHDHA